jgi:hypothetical protein
MSNRTAKFASAIFASLLAGAALETIPYSAARAADDCLSAPGEQTPEGEHWYYRIDRLTKRQCWYRRAEGEKPLQIAPANTSPSERPAGPKAQTATQRSIADAHAELPAPTRIEPPKRNDEPGPAMPANVAGIDNVQRSNAPDANAQSSVVATRWPEPSAVTSAVSPRTATDNVAANVQPAPAPPPATAAATPLAADSSVQGRPGSIPMLLMVIAGALALAGILASAVFKFGSTRRPRRGKVRVRRDAIWQPTDDDRIVLSPRAGADVLPRRPGFARDLDRIRDPNERVADFYAQISKRAPT